MVYVLLYLELDVWFVGRESH